MTFFFTAAALLAKRIYRNANEAFQPPRSGEPNHASSELPPDEFDKDDGLPSRFEYDPKNFAQRLVTGIGGKTKLATSQLLSIEYRSWMRWLLVSLLVVVTIFLTPQLLPKWLGFKWSTPSDLCANRDAKLVRLREKMESLARVTEGSNFVKQANLTLKCMQSSAERSWNGIRTVKYPEDCTPANAKARTNPTQVCVGGQRIEVCARFIGIRLKCKGQTSPRTCKTVTSSDPSSVQRIAEINAARRVHQNSIGPTNTQKAEVQDAVQTADKGAERIINRLLIQIDIASNMYIVYTMLAVIVGTPVIVFKRERTSRVLGSALGFRKANFIVLVVIILTIYDSGIKVFRDTNFPQLFRNFQNDPCYLDPKFSRKRLELIRDTCGKITKHRAELNDKFATMTSVFYDAQLCEVCQVSGFPRKPNPALVSYIDKERTSYSTGTKTGYVYPGTCNAKKLDEETSTPPDSGVSFLRAFLGSGVLAQILLKGVLASWLTHLIAYIEPMTMHRGIVEVFGIPEGTPAELNRKEKDSIIRFARDKHIVSLIVTSMLMCWEVAIIIYSIVETHRKSGNLLEEVLPGPSPSPVPSFSCTNLVALHRTLNTILSGT
eukprot:IDg1482t1